MKILFARTALLAAVALGSGCAMIKVPQTGSGESSPQGMVEYGQEAEEVLGLLGYYQKLGAMSAEEQRKEYGAVSQAFARDKAEKDRFRLAMLLSLPGTAFRDDAKLIALLDGAATRSWVPESPRRNLILLLQRQAQERNRLANQAGQSNQARDAAREQVEKADKERARAEAQAAEEKRRADELQQKLDALLAIERELRNRPPGRTTR
jgi:hypothetical protein